jgi:hypothetical protein
MRRWVGGLAGRDADVSGCALTRDGEKTEGRQTTRPVKRCLIADTLGIHIITAAVALGESGDGVAGLDSAQGT